MGQVLAAVTEAINPCFNSFNGTAKKIVVAQRKADLLIRKSGGKFDQMPLNKYREGKIACNKENL